STRALTRRWSPSTTASSRRSARTQSSAATSSSRTPTATATPTPSSARSRRPTRSPTPRRSRRRTSDSRARAARTRPRPPPPPPAPAGANRSTPHEIPAAKGSSPHPGPPNTEELRSRLFANPARSGHANPNPQSVPGELDSLLGKSVPGYETFKNYVDDTLKATPANSTEKPLKAGSHVTGGTVLGTVGRSPGQAPHLNFAIRPVGKGAPLIDPKPILDGWKLLETTAIYRAAGEDPFNTNASVGQVLLMPKGELEQRVLADP